MTILGKHTVQETRDLIRATEFRVNQNQQQLTRIQMQRQNPITGAQVQLNDDMTTFVKRWIDVRDKATLQMLAAVLATPSVPPFLMPAEDQYIAVDTATRITDPRLVTIEQRIDLEAQTLQIPPTNLSQTPPQNSPDADFAALKKLDSAIASGEAAAAAAAKSAGNAAKSNTGLIIGAGIVAIGGIVIATKVYL